MSTQAVDITVRGVYYTNKVEGITSAYTGVIYKADTSSRDRSQAKIGKVSTSHDKKGDGTGFTNNDFESLLFWDKDTAVMLGDLFYKFPKTAILQITKPSQNMETPVNGDFMGAANLKQVFITNQKFLRMGSSVFEGVVKIESIYLEQNLIDSIDEQTFKDAKTLKKLSLQGNLIKSLANATFAALLELEFLNLSNNLLTMLSPVIFENNKKLKSIMLDSNHLLYIHELKIPANAFLIFEDNLCVSESFFDPKQFKQAVDNKCNIRKTPAEILREFKKNSQVPQTCNKADMEKMMDLKEQIKNTEDEIIQLNADHSKLEEILRNIETVQVCQSRDEL